MSEDPVSTETIATGVSRGLRRSRVRLNDRRLLVIYLLMAAYVVFFTYRSNQQTNQIREHNTRSVNAAVALCEQTNAGNMKINLILIQLATNAQNTKGLTAAQKAQAAAIYSSIVLTITDCSKLIVK